MEPDTACCGACEQGSHIEDGSDVDRALVALVEIAEKGQSEENRLSAASVILQYDLQHAQASLINEGQTAW